MKIFGIDGWFDYADADKKIEAGRNRYSAPAVPNPDKPDDKLATQAQFSEALKKQGALTPTSAFALGMRSTVDKGPLTGSIMNALAGNTEVPAEAQRKMSYAAAENNPIAYAGGQVLGAIPAAVDWGLTGVSALGMGAKALMFGSKAPAAVSRASGPVGQWTSALTTDGKASYLARLAKNYPITASLGAMLAGGAGGAVVGENVKSATAESAKEDQKARLAAYAAENPDYALAQAAYDRSLKQGGGAGPTVLDRGMAGTSVTNGGRDGMGQGVAPQYWAQIHNPDGSLKPGITPEMEKRARAAVEMDAWAVNDHLRDPAKYPNVPTYAVPEDAFPGGAAGGAVWQNQFNQYDKLVEANKGQRLALADIAASPEALDAVATPMNGGAAPGALADIMDSYEAQFPGNEGGSMSDAQYRVGKRLAQQERQAAQDELNVRLGAQFGITDPTLAAYLGRQGAFTQGMVARNIEAQQGGSTPDPLKGKDLVIAMELEATNRLAARAEAEKDPAEKKRLQTMVSKAREKLSTMVLTGDIDYTQQLKDNEQ